MKQGLKRQVSLIRNLKLKIEYAGTNYCGWQEQDVKKSRRFSLQQVIEKAIFDITREQVKLVASGRTDAGVHALAQIANFKSKTQIPLDRLRLALNSRLPQDIVIHSIKVAPLNFHSRFSAKSKLYRYTILNREYSSALLNNLVYFFPQKIDLRLMQKEAKYLVGRHDFSAFRSGQKEQKQAIRQIKYIRIKKDKDFIHIDIEADGFLYNMMRNIAGTLLEVGLGRLKKGDIKRILLSKDRTQAFGPLPACGLSLIRVKY